ncbi:alpha-hydroxy acid oxidase [Herbidospora cretacea]|uniref:alpha-hydroxy acid oxidase n=1 Tax=Herbidospora cretacea TaxID=28444 RepID=UPI000773695C|nr:alpha-hydroxy acid oxidase [Herbidospora cretacea]
MSLLTRFEAAARERLPQAHYDYFAGGAGDESTVAENEAAFGRLRLAPRVLSGAPPDPAVTLLGCRASMPLLIAPTAFHRLAHPDGELATARAAAAEETVMVVSMASTTPVEALADTGADLWFQLYVQPDMAFTERIVARAEKAGCRALVVTADSPVFGARPRDLHNDFHSLPEGLACENLREGDVVRPIEFSPEISWARLDRLREVTDMPLVVKGVTHPADARLAAGHGAALIMVSNHGGRQLDRTAAAIDLLPAVVDALVGAVPVTVDGGIRRGTDVVTALALGAQAVLLGRPVLWGLAAAGEAGVREVLAWFRAEIELATALVGGPLDPSVVRPC